MTCADFTGTLARTTGARFHADSRLFDQCPVGTAHRARAEEEAERDIKDFAGVGAATNERCRRKFFKATRLKMRVCGACGSRDPRSEYEVKELTAVGPAHWVRIPKVPM